MAQNSSDFAKMSPVGMDGALKMWSELAKSWQAVGAEMNDYAKRSFEDSSKTLEKLMSARTPEQAIEIQSSYVQRSYEGYMQQMTRLGTMYAEMAKDSAKPLDATGVFGR